jgi:hypothetical protein
MNAALNARILFSDSAFDEHWLLQLFDLTPLSPSFVVRRMSSETLVRQFAAKHSIPAMAVNDAFAYAASEYPPIHRAAQDAAHWAAIWRFMLRSSA